MHLVASVGLVGGAALLLIAGHSDRPTALGWQRRIVTWSGVLALVAVAAALVAIAQQTAVVSGRNAAALEPASILRVVLETHAGRIWLARLGLLALLAAFVASTSRMTSRQDWLAVRGEVALLGALALGLIATAGHAAAVAPDATAVIAFDALHVLATGVWIGGLLPLAALLRAASREDGADARPYAVLAAGRFSRVALACVVALVASGVVNAIVHVGGVPALLGTTYGRLLIVKLGLIVPILVIGGVNRRRLLPRLSGDAVTVGRPAMRDLGRFVHVEAALAVALLAVVSAMSVTPPGRHADPTWPLSFRLTFAAIEGADLRRVLVGSQVMVLGLAALLCAALLRGRRLALGVGAAVLLAFGAGLTLPPISVDAYPTTYRRPAVTYQAASIVEGAGLYRIHCASCHGPTGAGDGPARPALPRPPADLRAPHTIQHTAGDIFWWITAGIPAARMPAFGGVLNDDQRWHLINFVRALGSGAAAQRLGPGLVAPELVAPDFTFAVGPTPPRTLKDYRGRRIVALVLYALPASRPRLAELAQHYEDLARRGVEVIAVPRDASSDAIRRLGDEPRVLFPIVTDGAREIIAAYDLFVSLPHAELLIDRAGYLRARWTTPPAADELLAAVDRLNAEPMTAPPAADHAH
ncbi:MAG TPA: CopD family protein [Candidatus Acidoferrum sp.]|nr:CopD family protein [Candidatus Acidoferrum sp.]